MSALDVRPVLHFACRAEPCAVFKQVLSSKPGAKRGSRRVQQWECWRQGLGLLGALVSKNASCLSHECEQLAKVPSYGTVEKPTQKQTTDAFAHSCATSWALASATIPQQMRPAALHCQAQQVATEEKINYPGGGGVWGKRKHNKQLVKSQFLEFRSGLGDKQNRIPALNCTFADKKTMHRFQEHIGSC